MGGVKNGRRRLDLIFLVPRLIRRVSPSSPLLHSCLFCYFLFPCYPPLFSRHGRSVHIMRQWVYPCSLFRSPCHAALCLRPLLRAPQHRACPLPPLIVPLPSVAFTTMYNPRSPPLCHGRQMRVEGTGACPLRLHP